LQPDQNPGTNGTFGTFGTMRKTILLHECSIGLESLFELFGDQIHLFPRTISTRLTRGGQIPVNSKEEALAYFKLADFQDCRINAYPYWRPSTVSDFVGIKNPIAPDIIMIDLDLDNCDGNMYELDKVLKHTLRRIKQRFNLPVRFTLMVVWSGNGYHIYLPISAVTLENVQEFQMLEDPSIEFLRFAESYLSEGRSDPAHNNTVTFKNCMLRVPRTFNSKHGQQEQVTTIKKWSKSIEKPHMKSLIGSFCIYLDERRIKQEREYAERIREYTVDFDINNNESYTIDWIERLLQTPLEDHRKFAVWMILPQYLINCKKLPYDNARSVVEHWLDRCSQLKRLDRIKTKQKLKAGFEAADRGIRPIRVEKMRVWKPDLYELLFPH
jgi:hypothetical protein